MNGRAWPLVRWLLLVQMVLAGVAAVCTAIITTWVNGLYVILGGAIASLLTWLFAMRLFTVDASREPQQAVRALYRAVATKLVVAVVVFVIAAKYVPGRFLPLVFGFCAATVGYWFALLRAHTIEHNEDH